MSSRDYFVVGCKVVGLYCIFLSLNHFIKLVDIYFTPIKLPPELVWSVTNITITIIIPIIFLLIGIYLIRNGKFVHDIAYPSLQTTDVDDSSDDLACENNKCELSMNCIITLAFQFAGIYLILSNFPDLLKVMSYYIAKQHSSNLFQMPYTYFNFLPSLGGMLLGIYLLRVNNLFTTLALNEPNKSHFNHESGSSTCD
ncbi:MAG: hypothetical protein ABSE08_14355 [Syntrophobacteraceae bacterium]|jgi:hypothetical protein